MALAGAELLLYPTAIGSEPEQYEGAFDSSVHWQNAMCGHAAANIMPVIASNRIGREVATQDSDLAIEFYGSSFIADHTGEKVAVANRTDECALVHEFDLDAIAHHREVWGVYRDRRPHHYKALMALDGQVS